MPPTKGSTPTNRTKKRKRKSNSRPSFNFLGLPAELPNEVYAVVWKGQTKAYLSARTNGKLAVLPRLLRGPHQLRNECLSMLAETVPEIVATGIELDFGHLIKLFNHSADAELNTLPTTSKKLKESDSKIIVELEITGNVKYFVDRLQRWTNRFARPSKRGANIFVEYRLVSKSMDDMKCFKGIVRGMHSPYEDGRQLDELKRMLAKAERAMTA